MLVSANVLLAQKKGATKHLTKGPWHLMLEFVYP